MIIFQIKIYKFDGKTPEKIDHWPINYTFEKISFQTITYLKKNATGQFHTNIKKLALDQLHICKIKWPSRPITYL